MTYEIEILPSGHRIENQPGESLLESALNAGLPVDYGCSNGNCGKCRARLVSGSLAQLRHSDFVFPPADKRDGWFLMCCHAASTDLVIDTGLAAGSADIEWQEIDVKVRKIEPLGERYTLVHVQTPRTRRLRFLAGQSARLSGEAGGCVMPIASCPCDDRNIHFHVPNDPLQCAGSDRLTTLRPGATLHLAGPIGDFVLDAGSKRPRLMIGSGPGLAPLKSIAEHSLALAPAIPVRLLLLEGEGETHYLRNLFRSWRDALENFSFETASVDAPERSIRDFLGAVDADPAHADCYVAGSPTLIRTAAALLESKGFPADHVHSATV